MKNIGFVGAGNMGGALISGLLKDKQNYTVFVFDVNEKIVNKHADNGAIPVESIGKLADKCEYIIVAVKPNIYDKVLDELASADYNKTVITIAPGISIEHVKEKLNNKCKVVRTMPNTPALISMGVTLIAKESGDELDEVAKIFKAVGEVYYIPEKMMNAGVALSGSSPAYVYAFINALADGAALQGIPKKSALEIAANTVIGSALMVLRTGKHPMELLDNVCSPGGTTIEAVNVLKENNFEITVIKAMNACTDKSNKMSKGM